MHSASVVQDAPFERFTQVREAPQIGVDAGHSLSEQQFADEMQLPSLHMWWVASQG